MHTSKKIIMKKQLVIFGGSSGLAKDLCLCICNDFNIICLSTKQLDSSNKKIKYVHIDDYSLVNISNFINSLDIKKEHLFLFMNGITDSSAFYKLSNLEIANIIKVNLELPVLITNILVKKFILKRAKYVYFSSSRAFLGDRGISLYSATKSSLKYFSRSLSLEYGKFNQFFYTISLGVFKKGLAEKVKTTDLDRIIKRAAINDCVSIDELKKLIIYISESDSASGSLLNIDNGYH